MQQLIKYKKENRLFTVNNFYLTSSLKLFLYASSCIQNHQINYSYLQAQPMQEKETDNQIFHQQFSNLQRQQLPPQLQPNQSYPPKLDNQPSNQNLRVALSKWKAQLDDQNINNNSKSSDEAELTVPKQKMIYRLPPFIVDYVPRQKIQNARAFSPALITQRNYLNERISFNVSQIKRKPQIQVFKVENLVEHLPQQRAQKQANLRFYTGYADCKDECSEEEYIPEKQLVIIEDQVGNGRKKRKYVQKKMWKGICSILDRKYHFNPSVSQYFDEQQLLNPSFTSDQCKLWKNLMNKYVTEIKHKKISKQRSKANSLKFQNYHQSALLSKNKKKSKKPKKCASGSKTETLIKKFNYVPPFMPIMMPDMANFPLLFPQAFQMMDQNINLKIQQIEEIKNQITSILFQSSAINKIESNSDQMAANLIRCFSTQIFNVTSNVPVKEQNISDKEQILPAPFFLEYLPFEKKVMFLKMLEQSIKYIKDKDHIIDEMIQNCTRIYCELKQQKNNDEDGIKQNLIQDFIKEEVIEDERERDHRQ